jgi:hypothetical protein
MTAPMKSLNLMLPAVFGLALFSAPLAAAETPAKAAPTPAASPTPSAPKIEKHDVLLMDISINDQLVLARMNPDGSCRQYLKQGGGFSAVLPSSNKGDDFAPAASADGKALAFYSTRHGAANLWICDASGLNQRAISDSDSPLAEFRPTGEPPIQFSPDSKWIAYLQGGDLWICSASGLNPRSLTHEQGVSAFTWEPLGDAKDGKGAQDAKRLAYLRYGSIRSIGVSGQPDELLAADAANYPTLSFNPNAKSHELFCFYNGVWKLNTLTKKRERLAGSFCFPNRVRSSPSGDAVAFLSFSSDVREEIYTAVPGKKGSTQLTLGGAAAPFYSRDGKWIYFTRKGGLWRINLQSEKAYSVYNGSVFAAQAGELEFSAAAGACP